MMEMTVTNSKNNAGIVFNSKKPLVVVILNEVIANAAVI